MKYADEVWAVACKSVAEKQQLFDYAASKGAPILNGPILFEMYDNIKFRDDEDLIISYLIAGYGFPDGLCSAPQEEDFQEFITPEKFRQLCDEYATV